MEVKLAGVYFSGSLKTHYIPQPENQLLKEADEADSGPLQHSDAGQTGQASPLFSIPLKLSHL